MLVGFEMLFSRDLICKYLSDEFLRGNREQLQYIWQVIGTYDFVKIRPLESLEGLIAAGNAQPTGQVSLEFTGEVAHSGLVLFPSHDLGPEASEPHQAFRDFTQRLDAGKEFSQNAQDYPLLVGARLILSPVALELAPLYCCVLDAVSALATIIRAKAREYGIRDERRFQVFRSLSSPDVVILGLPKNPQELSDFDRLFQALRSLQLQELGDAMGKIQKDSPDSVFQHLASTLPGHALSALDEMLAFRLNDQGKFCWEEDPTQFTTIDIALRVEVGHEEWVRDWSTPGRAPDAPQLSIDFLQQEGVGPLHTWDRHPLRGKLKSLSEFVENWRVLFTNYPLRQANLVDTHAVLSFPQTDKPQQKAHDGAGVWELRSTRNKALTAPADAANTTGLAAPVPEVAVLTPVAAAVPVAVASPPPEKAPAGLNEEIVLIPDDPLIWDELREISDTLRSWSQEFLSESQRQEFLNTVHTFQNCFVHHELASAARDLVPFFRQLSFACDPSMFDHWHNYRKQVNIESFSREVSALIAHLHQAVRNRLEHRSKSSDPTNPHTLEHGACKLVNAYSAMYWFVSELFSRTTNFDPDKNPRARAYDRYCTANQLAVAVASGHQGRISCREIFSGFREYWEKLLSEQPPAGVVRVRITDSLPKPRQWSARLLLLEVSGKALFRPEICLVHCCHEVAELSDWLTTAQTVLLRLRLNAWILHYFIEMLCQLVRQKINKAGPEREFAAAAHAAGPGRSTTSTAPRHVDEKNAIITQLNEFLDEHLAAMLFGSPSLGRSHIENEHPVEFCEEVTRRMVEHLPDSQTWRTVAPNGAIPLLMREVREVVVEPEFQDKGSSMSSLVREISADIGMWCALDHLASEGLPFKRTVSTRLLDVHRTFSNVVQAHVERCANKITEQEADLFLLRWSLQAAAVAGPGNWEDSLCQWITAEIDGQNAPHLATLRTHLLSATERTLPEVLPRLIANYPLVLPQNPGQSAAQPQPTTLGTAPPQPEMVLATRLNGSELASTGAVQFIYYGSNHTGFGLNQTFRFPFPKAKDLGEAERALWEQFTRAWNQPDQPASAATSSKLARAQIELVFHMWAKSCRLRYKQAFQMTVQPKKDLLGPGLSDKSTRNQVPKF
ncbi:MAG: hypothetical protein JWN70_5974 [Planctomycetaceae bacterium]|nr:hypothetical protein [Planctomycetaceae bacterium]